MRTSTREIKLLEKCLKGNSQAFEVIVAKYQDLVCAITFSGVTDFQESEELAHQTFVNAWKNLSQLKDLSRFKPWLCTIARNNIRNFLNKNQRDIIAKSKAMENINDTAADEAGPLESAIRKEHEELVRDAIRRIPEEYREPLVLYYRQQQSVKQVAQSLDLSIDVVKQRLQRGRNVIKEQISSIVEETLSATRPKKTFTTAVIASIAGITVKGTGAAAAAGIAAGMSKAGTTTGIAALMSGVTGKIITAVAVVVIGVVAVVTYKHITKDNNGIEIEKEVTVADEKEPAEDKLSPAKVEGAGMESGILQKGILQNKTDETVVTVPSKGEIAAAADPCQEHAGATEYQFKAKGVLSGLITDIETGEPVVNTVVTLGSRNYETKTDENGFYSLDTIRDEGNYRIGVFSKDYIGIVEADKQPRIYLKKDSQLVKHFQLPRACMVDTYVVDENGNPIPDTSLWVTSLAEERGRIIKSSFGIGTERTDKDGYALLGGLAAAKTQYLITAVHTRYGKWIKENNRKYREQIREYAPAYFKVTLQDPNIIEYCEIVLKKGETVRGIAKYSDGTPAKECKIVPRPDWWHSLYSSPRYPIDANGAFTLSRITPGTYHIQVSIPYDGGGGATVPTVFTTKLPLGNGKLLEVTVPKNPTEVLGSVKRTRQDDPKPKLYGIVTDEATGQPVNDFRIRYKKIKGNYFGSIGTWSQFSDTKGAFELDVSGSEDAICQVQAVAEGYASQWSEQIDTANNSAVSIKLTRGGSIVGTVVDGRGNAVENAKVLPFSLAGSVKILHPLIFSTEEGAVTTNKDGQFILKNLAAGTEYLKVVHPEYTYLISSAFPVGEGEENDIGNLVLENGGTLEGFVYDYQGKPQPNVTLYAKNHYAFSSSIVQHATATTDPNGFYRMKHLPGELIYITVGKAYEKTGVVGQCTVPANDECTRLDFGGGPVVKGRIVLNGKPLSQTKLKLTLGNPTSSGLYRCQANTDENGHFMLRAGIGGTYTLSYDKRTKVSTSQNFKLLDVVVGRKDIDLGVIPAKGKTLRIRVEIVGETEEKVRWFLLRENNPVHGACVYWIDQPALSDMPLQIDNLRPGFYYAAARLDGRGEYRLPIEITKENDSFDINFPIQDGHVTLTGSYPQDISHVMFTNNDMTISKVIYQAKETGKYRIDGLLPGTYFLNPKWPDFTDSLVVTIPNTFEYTFDLESAVLQEKLKEHLFVHVMDEDGYPVENAAIWIECTGKILRPAWYDGYSGRFYLRGGEHIIHAEKDGLKAQKAYEFYVDKNNTASMESRETFIQFQQRKSSKSSL